MNQPDYTLATADVLTAATLARPEAKKAAVRAVLESYFPATGETRTDVPPLLRQQRPHEIALMILKDGRTELWEGTTYRGTFNDLDTAVADIKRRAQP